MSLTVFPDDRNGATYHATPEAWNALLDKSYLGDGCGIKISEEQLHTYAGGLVDAELIDALYEGFEYIYKYGTKPLGADFSIACQLHDIEFKLRDKRGRDLADFSLINEMFRDNLESARLLPVTGWRKYLMRWQWYRRSRDSLLRRVIRLYGWLVGSVGKQVWLT